MGQTTNGAGTDAVREGFADALLKRIKAGKLGDGFTVGNVMAHRWPGMGNTFTATDIIRMLVARGEVTGCQCACGSKKTIYRLIRPEAQ
jgi:hypothetical protein